MTRTRPLKVYFANVTPKAVVGELFDHLPRYQRIIGGFVAAYNVAQARDLLALSAPEWSRSGRVSSSEHHRIALAEPGQVFLEPIDSWDKPIGGEPVRAGRHGRLLEIGAPSSLEMADELIASEKAAAARRKEQALTRQVEQRDRRHRIADSERLAEDTLERVRPDMERLGIHPKTVTPGAYGDRRGVLIPAETFEMLLRLADTGHTDRKEEMCPGDRGRKPRP